MDLASLTTELQLRGFSQDMVDTAFRCLVHVYAVQDIALGEKGGILVEDVLNTYPIEVVQAAAELFLDEGGGGEEKFYRVRWGYEEAARIIKGQLWDHSSLRWNEYVSSMNDRYLGFFLPQDPQDSRVVTTWRLRNDLKWFSVAIPRHGWNILRLIDDIVAVAWKLDLAFGFRPFGAEGVQAQRVLLHEQAFEALRQRAVLPPGDCVMGIKLWKFFSEYDVNATDIVALMEECNLTLEEVVGQVDRFYVKNLTSRYREGQYPPYFVNDKKKKEFQEEVWTLLAPMDAWLSRTEPSQEEPRQGSAQVEDHVQTEGESISGLAKLVVSRRSKGPAFF